jgi:hypothetical protein
MTATAVPTVTRSTFGTSTTDHNVSMPSSVTAGRLLVALLATGAHEPNTPTGWADKGTAINTLGRLTVRVKVADGSEGGGTVNFTTSSADVMVAHVWYFDDPYYTIDDCVALGTAATGSSSNPDPPNVSPGWGSTDFTVLAAGAAYGTGTFNSYPSSYSGGVADQVSGLVNLGSAYRQLTASSENPGAFGLTSTPSFWAAQSVAVRLNPSPPAPDPPSISSVSPSTFAFGEAGIVISGSDFGATKGTGKVELSDNASYASGTKQVQTTTSWSNTSITFTAIKGSLSAGTLYVWVTNNNGDRNSTGYAVTATDDEPPPPPPPPAATVLTGALQVVVYGSPPVAAIDEVLSASIEEGIERLPSARFTAPLRAAGVSAATAGTEIGIRRQGEGEIFRGYVQRRTERVDSAGAAVVEFDCVDVGIELQRRNTGRSVLVLGESMAAAATAILSGAGWTLKVTGSGYPTVTKEWTNVSLLQAIGELARIGGGYWRRTHTVREIEIINTNPATGLTVTNLANVDPVTQTRFGAIAQVNRIERDVSQVVNRVWGEIKTDSARLITLQESTRSSPYTIQSAVKRAARVVSYAIVPSQNSSMSTSFPMLGENRYALALLVQSGLNNESIATIGGQFMANLDIGVDGANTAVWGGIAPPKGSPQVDFKIAVPSPTLAGLVGAENVDQVDPIVEADKANGTGTSVSITVDSITGSVVVAFLVLRTLGSPSVTPGTGVQLVGKITNLPSTSFDEDQITIWRKEGGASTTTMTWTISPSQAWEVYAISLRPARLHYIEDAASQAQYGLIEQALSLGSFGEVETSRTALANAAYDYLADYLTKRKDAPFHVDCDLAFLPGSPLDWLPGETMAVRYRDDQVALDEDLIVVGRSQEFGVAGERRWSLDLSSASLFRRDERGEWLLEQIMNRLSAAQANQV